MKAIVLVSAILMSTVASFANAPDAETACKHIETVAGSSSVQAIYDGELAKLNQVSRKPCLEFGEQLLVPEQTKRIEEFVAVLKTCGGKENLELSAKFAKLAESATAFSKATVPVCGT